MIRVDGTWTRDDGFWEKMATILFEFFAGFLVCGVDFKRKGRMTCMHDNLIRQREGGRLPLEVRLGSQVDIVAQMTNWTRNINLTLNIGLRVFGLFFGLSGSPCFLDTNMSSSTKQDETSVEMKGLETRECGAG